MKRTLAFLLALVMVLSLCACGRKSSPLTASELNPDMRDPYVTMEITAGRVTNEEVKENVRTAESKLYIRIDAIDPEKVDIDSISVKITLDDPVWEIVGSSKIEMIGDGTGAKWIASVPIEAKSYLVGTKIRPIESEDVSVKVTYAKGTIYYN